MAISSTISDDQKTVTIKMGDRFDFSCHSDLRNSYKDINTSGVVYVVDMQQTNYVDSSGLGMLLLLKEHTEKYNSSVKVQNANDQVVQLLKVAHFDQLFTIV